MVNNPIKMRRILSIQSHVVSGYVGNKAATFPLQLLGFDVDVINSVHFSNHTGYTEGFEGDILGGDQLRKILVALERNGLVEGIDHLLTGYIGSESFLRAVLDVLKVLRRNENVRYVCDPVLGDHGKFYCPEELVDIYREEVIPLSDIVTPNQFEVEQLTGVAVTTISDARKACKILHELGPEFVFITSIVLDEDSETSAKENTRCMTMIASRKWNDGNEKAGNEIWRIDSPIIEGNWTGTGDLCAALLLAWTEKEKELSIAIERVIGTMFSVIKRTKETSGDSVASKELKLIESKQVLEDPPTLFRARQL